MRTVLVPAAIPAEALDELKRWLAISTDAEDAALEALLRASLELCEAFTGTLPLAATVEEILPARPGWQALATRPVQAIAEVEGIPAEGPRFAFAADAYEIDLDAEGGGLVRVVRQGAAGRIAVQFSAGLAAGWTALPDALRHGTLRLASELYRARDGETATIPAAVAALWRPWRRVRL